MTKSKVWRWLGSVLLFAALLAAAMYLRNHQMDTVAAHQPIDVRGSLGAEASGRNVTGEVIAVHRTQSLSVPTGRRVATDGTFLVVEFEAATLLGPGPIQVDLEVDGTTHTALDVPGGYERERVNPGIRLRGTAVFEIPTAAANGDAQFRITGSNDPRLDSRLVFEIALADAPNENVVDVIPTMVAS